MTHSGKSKNLRYLENSNRYKKYQDKIKYIVYDQFPTQYTSWMLENNQRRFMITAIPTSIKDSDLVFISDVDEIPRRSFMEKIVKDHYRNNSIAFPVTLCTQLYYNKLTYKVTEPDEFHNWRGTVVIDGKTLKQNSDLHWYRHYKDTFPNIKNTGWHFSYLGDEKQIIEKIESFAHTESDTPEIKETIRNNLDKCVDLFGRTEYKMEHVEVDDTYPELVKNNIERFRHLV
jgi:beta-1,4-mannosyl-glycoprotein beta-1,4-N-acetylglucosaminyltransferase